MSRCSEKAIYLQAGGRSSVCKVPLHLPSRKSLTLPDAGSLCNSHPDADSKSLVSLSTRENSAMEVIGGLQSSANPVT